MELEENKYTLTMWQGSTFGLSLTVKDANNAVQNLTGYSARMHIRPTYDSDVITESLTTSNGEIVITPAEGNLSFALDATRTANIYVDRATGTKLPKTVYVYDVELVTSGNTVSKILWGNINVYGEVTR
jgi:hypothetical protein